MSLSPEERRKIYEEEKARIEARESLERERKDASSGTSTGLMPNVASLLCYVGGWISGIIFFLLEQKNMDVRFHAAQSIIVFGILTIAGTILGLIPVIGNAFSVIIGIIAVILWVILMVKAYNGERYRVIWAADIADTVTGFKVHHTKSEPISSSGSEVQDTVQEDTHNRSELPPAPVLNLDREIGRKIEEYFTRKRGGRIAASAFAIAFSIVVLIFFNYFNDYVAFYSSDKVDGVTVWTRTPFFTDDISLWLPILTTALVVSIIGHSIMIIFDRYALREVLQLIIDAFSLASAITLVIVFPFDFSVIPSTSIAEGVELGVTVVLICVCVGIGIGILVRSIKFFVNLVKGVTNYEQGA
ncbi:MAG: hypothetical protein JSU58_07780 [Dehalococcoidales bacterium]|nr:MAG: hypothetical protein JSU58_07780 [Dehalococcoidales bacterium]